MKQHANQSVIKLAEAFSSKLNNCMITSTNPFKIICHPFCKFVNVVGNEMLSQIQSVTYFNFMKSFGFFAPSYKITVENSFLNP